MKWQADPPLHAWPQVLAATETAAARMPDHPAIWAGLAQSALTLGREDEAISPLLAAAARMPLLESSTAKLPWASTPSRRMASR